MRLSVSPVVVVVVCLPLLCPTSVVESLSNRSPKRSRRHRPVRLWAQPSSVATAKHPMMPSLLDMLDEDDDSDDKTATAVVQGSGGTTLPVVSEVTREDQLLQALSASSEKTLCVVMYSSKLSPVCQRAKLKYQKLALELGDCVELDCEDEDGVGRLCQSGAVTFAYVEWSQLSPLCSHIAYLPHVDIYDVSRPRPALVASFATMGPSYNFGIKIRKTVKSLLSEEPSDRLDKELSEEGEERLRWWTEHDRQQKFGI